MPLKDVVEQHKASLQDQLDSVKKRYSSTPVSLLITVYNTAEAKTTIRVLTSNGKNISFFLLLPSVATRLPEIDSALQTLSEILQQLTNQKSSIEDDIHTTFDELQKTLNVRKSVLLMELEVNYGLKQKVNKHLKGSSLL